MNDRENRSVSPDSEQPTRPDLSMKGGAAAVKENPASRRVASVRPHDPLSKTAQTPDKTQGAHTSTLTLGTSRQGLLLAFHFDSGTTTNKIAFDWPPFLPDRSNTGTAI